MRRIWRLGVGFAVMSVASGCGSDKDTDGGSTPSGSMDTSSSTDDSSEPIDTAETGDAASLTPLSIRLSSDMVEAGATLSVHRLDYEAWTEGEVEADSALLEAAVFSESLTIEMPDPTADELHPASEGANHSVALYVVALRTEDGGGEHWRGVSETWLMWSTDDLSDNGVAAGWNFFSPSTSEFSAAGMIQVQANLNPIDVLSFGGVFEAERATGLRGVLIPLNENSTVDEKLPVVDEPLTENWSFELNGRPPENHFYFSDKHGVECAGELPAAYIDVDGDAMFSPEKDAVAYNACFQGDRVVAYYWEVIRELDQAIEWAVVGWRPGWVLARQDSEKGLLLSEQEREGLTIGKDCLPENTEPR